jgi:hypothetical protein
MNGRSPPPGPPPTAASKRSTSANRQAAVAFWTTVYFPTWGRILGRNPDKSLNSFLLAIHSQVSTALPWDFYFFKLTQPLTVSTVKFLYTVKEKEGTPDRKPYPFPYGLTKSTQKPQGWELSSSCIETSTKLYVHEFGFWTACCWHIRLIDSCFGKIIYCTCGG